MELQFSIKSLHLDFTYFNLFKCSFFLQSSNVLLFVSLHFPYLIHEQIKNALWDSRVISVTLIFFEVSSQQTVKTTDFLINTVLWKIQELLHRSGFHDIDYWVFFLTNLLEVVFHEWAVLFVILEANWTFSILNIYNFRIEFLNLSTVAIEPNNYLLGSRVLFWTLQAVLVVSWSLPTRYQQQLHPLPSHDNQEWLKGLLNASRESHSPLVQNH